MLKLRDASVAVTVALAVVALAGCGTAGEGAQPTTTSASATPSPTRTATPTPTPTPTPTRTAPPPPPMAVDGTRYQECADGTCEVAIAKPVRISLSDGNVLRIKKVTADSIDIDLSLAAGGGGNGTLKGNCGSTFQFSPAGGGGRPVLSRGWQLQPFSGTDSGDGAASDGRIQRQGRRAPDRVWLRL